MAKPLRIFISSPGDVASERRRAALVVESLKKEFARFFDITAYLWEHEAMLATGHFQDVIEPPSQSDIVVLILWSRLGTPLPEKSGKREYRGIDGRAPVTGTEWEYEEALAANRDRGAPDLLVYRSNKEPQISLRDPSKKALAEGQWQALEGFWTRHFQAGGVFLSAFHGFDDLEDFGDMLEAHLRQLIRAKIEKGRMDTGGSPESKATWLQSPFRGLSSYDFEHAPIFFGRGAAQLKAVEQVVKNANEGKAFLLVLGASGSGKSSLVRAGLLPNLFARGVADGAGLWRRVAFKPGDADGNLFLGLAKALVEDRTKEGIGLPEILGPGVTVEQLENALRRSMDDPSFVFQPALGKLTSESRATGRIMAHESAKLAIVLDQLEEIFTDSAISTEERNSFIRLIGSLSKTGNVWIIATMRSDFWHKAAATPELVALADGTGRMDLLPPSQAEQAEMIRRPAVAAGLTFEDHPETKIGLDAVIAEEAARDPGSLPLVSFMLDALYKTDVEGGKSHTLTYDTYQALGGIRGAIAKRADEILNAQSADVQAAFPSVLRALVTVDSDRDQNATARVTPLTAFPAGSARRALVEAFLDPKARLLIADGDGAEARVRVAHEALINHWTRAREQINRDRRDLETRARLEEDEQVWRAAPDAEKSARLLEGLALEEGKDLVRKWDDELPQSLKEYIEVSNNAATRKRRRSFRILTGVAAVMAVLAVGSGVAGIYAINYAAIADENAVKAQQAADEANSARAATAEQLKETKRGSARLIERQSYAASRQGYPELALALAVESVRVGEEAGELPRASLAALQHAASTDTISSVLSDTDVELTDVAFGGDPSLVLTQLGDGRARLWNSKTGAELHNMGNDSYTVTATAMDPAGNYMIVAYSDRDVEIFTQAREKIGNTITLANPATVAAIDAGGGLVVLGDDLGNVRFINPADGTTLAEAQGHQEAVTTIAISNDRSIVVTGDASGNAVIWDAATHTQRTTVIHGGAEAPNKVDKIVISPSGDRIVIMGNGFATIVGPDGAQLAELSFTGRYLYGVVFSPDGLNMVYAAGKNITVVPASDPLAQGRTLAGHTFEIRGLDISSDGKRLLSYSGDNTLRLWDFASGATLRLFRSPKGTVNAQALSHDGQYVAAVFDDGNAVVWAVEKLAPLNVSEVHKFDINSLVWSADGTMILTGSGDGTAMVTDAESGFPIFHIDAVPDGRVNNAIYTRDNREIITAGNDGSIKSWDVQSMGDPIRTLAQLEDGYAAYWVALGKDDATFAVAAYGSVRIFDKASGGEVRRLNTPGLALFAMAVSPDGKYVAAGAADGRVFIWEYATGRPIAVRYEHRSTINTINFSPDSKRIVTGSSDRMIRIWDAETGEVQQLLSGHDDLVLSANFSDDGQRIVSASFDASVRLWDAETGAELGNFTGPGVPFRSARFSPDGRFVAAVGDDLKLYLWDWPAANGANTATAGPILSAELNAGDKKLLKEMIAWAPLTLSKPLSPADRQVNFLEPDPDVRRFDAPDTCDVLAAYPSDPQRHSAGAKEGNLTLPEALNWCKAAVEATPGEPRFHLQYGRALIANGDYEAGMKEVEVAIEAGYPGATYYKALMLITGEDPKAEDLKLGMELAAKAWAMNVPDAGDLIARQTMYGLKDKDGVEVVKIDVPAALKLYEEAAQKGSWFASINLAFFYEYAYVDEAGTEHVKLDLMKALYYFALAARQVEVEGFVEYTEARRAGYLFSHRASIARALVREGKSAEVAETARQVAAWKPPAYEVPAAPPAADPVQ